MIKTGLLIFGFFMAVGLSYYFNTILANKPNLNIAKLEMEINQENMKDMKLGAFSVSLSVKDLKVSKAFYENLGFTAFAGELSKNYLIMKNENSLIGLFQGMFEGNILTFNPGWDENAQNIENFEDVREIQKQLKNKNIPLTTEADETTSGPASIMLQDPDGNVILIDQHR